MRPLAVAAAFALASAAVALVPASSASEPHACGYVPTAYACAGGGVEGDCSSQGYAFDEVMLVTLAGYVYARGDSLCDQQGASTYEDDQVAVGAGTEVVAVGFAWYRFSSHDPENGDYAGCRMMPRVYSIVGPLVIQNLECVGGQDPPDPGWGRLLPALP